MRRHRRPTSTISTPTPASAKPAQAGTGVHYDVRRAAIVEAVVDLAATGGLEAVNLRDVAAAAGMTLGRVQHYFPTKNSLVAAAF